MEKPHGRVRGLVRGLGLSVERTIAQEAASSAVRGAAESLKDELPSLAEELQPVVQELLDELAEVLRSSLGDEAALPASTARLLAASVTRGFLDELDRAGQQGSLPIRDLTLQMNELLRELSRAARSTHLLRSHPGERAREAVVESMKAGMEHLRSEIDGIQADARRFIPLGREVACEVGQGLFAGVTKNSGEEIEALMTRAGRGLVHGLAEGLGDELRRFKGSGEAAALKDALTAAARRARAQLTVAGGAAGLFLLVGMAARAAGRRRR